MNKMDFIPVILGSDANAYGMARSFHEEYNIKSMVVAKAPLFATSNSKIVRVYVYKDFDKEDIFVEKLTNLAKDLLDKGKKLVLVASSDGYAELIIRHKKVLEDYYIVPFIDEDLMDSLINKEDFYNICEKYNLDYPKTFICTVENKDSIDLNFDFPVAIKPSDSLLYFKTSFEGKKKAYIAKDKEELHKIINTIYSSDYNKSLIIQEYIAGDDSHMRVLNCYCGTDGRVRMMCLGRPLLEDYTPSLIGNYVAIINEYNEDIYRQYKRFLEDIGYVGFANFDMKYDKRDGKFKVFEINLRQGRSSYFATGSGYNLAKYLVDDCIYNKDQDLVLANSEHLWLDIPKGLLLKYLEDEHLTSYVKRLVKEKKYSTTLLYEKDINIKRLRHIYLYRFRSYKRYKKYFGKRGI